MTHFQLFDRVNAKMTSRNAGGVSRYPAQVRGPVQTIANGIPGHCSVRADTAGGKFSTSWPF